MRQLNYTQDDLNELFKLNPLALEQLQGIYLLRLLTKEEALNQQLINENLELKERVEEKGSTLLPAPLACTCTTDPYGPVCEAEDCVSNTPD